MSLEGIKRIRRDQNETEKKESFKNPITDENIEIAEYDKTLAQVMQDPEEHRRFFEFAADLNDKRASDIVDAHNANKQWTASQHDFLDKTLKAYNARRAELEHISENLFTPEYVKEMASADKNLSQIVSRIGIEKTHDLLTKQLSKLGYSDTREFKKIVANMRKDRELSSTREARRADVLSRFYRERMGVSEDRIAEMVQKSLRMKSGFDASERRSLVEETKRNMHVLMRVTNFFVGGSISRARTNRYIEQFKKERNLMHKSDTYLSRISTALEASITSEQRLQMQQMIVDGGELKDVPPTNINNMSEMKVARETLSEAALKKRFTDAYIKEATRLGKTADPKDGKNKFTDTERDTFLDSFVEQEEKLQNDMRGSGVFAAILSLLFRSKQVIKNRATKLWP